MKKTMIRPICCLILMITAIGAFAQHKPSAEDSAVLASLPPLPAIDTTDAPDDELTRELKKLITKTNVMSAGITNMKALLDIQRKAADREIPAEFFDRFRDVIDNGRVAKIMENIVVKVYRQKFTVGEVKEINKFYDTPVGKKLAGETVSLSTATRAEGEKVGQFIGLQIARELIAEGKWK